MASNNLKRIVVRSERQQAHDLNNAYDSLDNLTAGINDIVATLNSLVKSVDFIRGDCGDDFMSAYHEVATTLDQCLENAEIAYDAQIKRLNALENEYISSMGVYPHRSKIDGLVLPISEDFSDLVSSGSVTLS